MITGHGSLNNVGYCNYFLPKDLRKVTVTGGNVFYGAFSWCQQLEEVSIDNVTDVQLFAFLLCNGLKTLRIGDNVR